MRATVHRWRDAVSRFFAPIGFGSGVVADKDGARVRSTYPDESSMAALARFPWVRAAARARVIDLASVPIVAIRTDVYGERQRVPHPLVALLNKPGARRGGVAMRRQLYLDHLLTGDCYLWRRDGLLFRLHPRSVTVIADPNLGIANGYIFQGHDGKEKRLGLDEVIHVSDISWEDGPRAAIGTGAIMALHHDLSANLAVKEMTARAARRGRLEILISPKGDGNAWSSAQVDKLVDDFEQNRQSGNGAFVVGRETSAMPLGLSPRDMEFGEQDLRTTAAILGVIGVPGVRVGLPGANYGTTKQQMRTYWEGLVGEAAAFDEALSLLDPDPQITLEHDFSRVEALQVSYSERQAQARGWWEMGATAKAAASYAGFVDAPLPETLHADTGQGTYQRPEQEPEEGQERARVLQSYLDGARARYARRIAADEWISGRDEESIRLLVAMESLGVSEERALSEVGRIVSILDETALQYRETRRSLDAAPAFGARAVQTLCLRMAA